MVVTVKVGALAPVRKGEMSEEHRERMSDVAIYLGGKGFESAADDGGDAISSTYKGHESEKGDIRADMLLVLYEE